jgi:hypothetical protein
MVHMFIMSVVEAGRRVKINKPPWAVAAPRIWHELHLIWLSKALKSFMATRMACQTTLQVHAGYHSVKTNGPF